MHLERLRWMRAVLPGLRPRVSALALALAATAGHVQGALRKQDQSLGRALLLDRLRRLRRMSVAAVPSYSPTDRGRLVQPNQAGYAPARPMPPGGGAGR